MICTCVFVLQNVFKTVVYKWKDKEEREISKEKDRKRGGEKKKKTKSHGTTKI